MTLKDYAEDGYVYHVVNIIDLKKTLQSGVRYNDKNTYGSKYINFHEFFDIYKPDNIPGWVERKKAIFASIRFKEGHLWHSHSAILKVKIRKEKCWVCNENLANFIYEPFILQHLQGFDHVRSYLQAKGREFAEEYWNNSLSYCDNLKNRYDRKEGYDAEILIMHPIPPEDIECMYIVSDHQIMSYKEWKEYFRLGNTDLSAQYSRYLQPNNMSSAWKAPGSE